MKKRRLKKWVKISLTIMTILASAVIYVLMAFLGTKGQNSIIGLGTLICGWIWLFLGQFGAYYFIWESEMNF